MWQAQIPVLSKTNRIIAIDLLGHGATDCIGYMHTMEDMAAVVLHVLKELKIRKVVLVGHSMGGYVALAFAELNPEMIKGVVLLNSTSRADSEDRKQNRDKAIKAVKQNYKTFIAMSISNLFSEKNRTLLENEIIKVKDEALKTPLQGIVAALEGMKVRKDREVILHFAQFPILLILGKLDPVLNFEECCTQVSNTKVNLVVFDDGHMSHIENRESLTQVLVSFIKGIR